MKTTVAIPKIPAVLGRESAAAEEELASHLRRALTAEQLPMQPYDVLAWADETLNSHSRCAGTAMARQ